MKRILLASAACFALSLPAMAATAAAPANMQNTGAQNTAQANTGMQNTGAQKVAQADTGAHNTGAQNNMKNQQAQIIRPSSLNKEQVREIQMKLNKAGFSAGHDDGIWGPDTDTAIRDYQKAKNLPGRGELNQQTLADLGVKMNNQTASSSNMNANDQQQSKSNQQSLSSGTQPAGSATNGQANANGNLNGSNANGQTASTSNHTGSTNNAGTSANAGSNANAGSKTKP